MFHIPYMKYHLELLLIDQLRLLPFSGSTLRGAFGYILKDTVCIHTNTGMRNCDTCIINQSCYYTNIFETQHQHVVDNPSMVTNYLPHPFIFEPPLSLNSTVYKSGDILPLNLIILGKPQQLLPYFVHTFERMGKSGLGYQRAKFVLQSVSINMGSKNEVIYQYQDKRLRCNYPISNTLETIQNANQRNISKINIKLQTPLRVKSKGRFVHDITFKLLIKNILRRLTTLGQAYGQSDITNVEVHRLLKEAEQIVVGERNTKWFDYQRYSTRQKQTMLLGGLIGNIGFSGDITPFYPYFKAAQILHVGKNTSFGLGKYLIKTVTGG